MQKILYIFRHGETDWNKEGKMQYWTDIELNETGLQQATKNAEILKDKNIQHIYSSPLKRAYKTAEILANTINVDITTIQDLIEFNGDKMTSMVRTEIKAILGEENYEKFFHTKDENLDFRIFNAETKREVRQRSYNCILNICKNTIYDIIGVATHGFFIREFLRSLDYEDDSKIKNCEVVKAMYDDGNLKILERFEK